MQAAFGTRLWRSRTFPYWRNCCNNRKIFGLKPGRIDLFLHTVNRASLVGMFVLGHTGGQILRFAIAFSLASLAVSPCFAAVLSNVQGSVTVTQGQTSRATTTATDVEPGDIVRTGPNSSTIVYYDNGCVFEIEENREVTIRQDPTCAGGEIISKGSAIKGVGAVAAIVLSDRVLRKDRPASP